MWKAASIALLFAFAPLALPGCSDAVSHQSDPTPSNDDDAVAGGSRDGDVTADHADASDHADAGEDTASDTANAESSDTKAAAMPDFSELTDAEWRKRLSDEEYYILREKGTERPWGNKYDQHFEPGSYACAGCGQVLFESDTKFDSGCGWPAFYAAKAGDRVKLHNDFSFGMIRTSATSSKTPRKRPPASATASTRRR